MDRQPAGLVHETYDSDRESRDGRFRYFPFPAPPMTGVYSPVYARAGVRTQAEFRGVVSPTRKRSLSAGDGSLSPREPEPEHERPPLACRSQLGLTTPRRLRAYEPETSPDSLEDWETEGASEAESYVPEGVTIFQIDTPNPPRTRAPLALRELRGPEPIVLCSPGLPLEPLNPDEFNRRGVKALRRPRSVRGRRARVPRPLGRWVDEMFDHLVVENLHVHYESSPLKPVAVPEAGEYVGDYVMRLLAVLPLALLPSLVTFPAAIAVAQSLAAKSGATSMVALLGHLSATPNAVLGHLVI